MEKVTRLAKQLLLQIEVLKSPIMNVDHAINLTGCSLSTAEELAKELLEKMDTNKVA